jgi:hypothetical protein
MLCYNSCFPPLHRSGVTNDSIICCCFSRCCKIDLLVYNLVLVFRLYVPLRPTGILFLVFHAFICSCILILLWEVSCLGEWLFGNDLYSECSLFESQWRFRLFSLRFSRFLPVSPSKFLDSISN